MTDEKGGRRLKTLEQEWLDFSAKIFRRVNPSPTQFREMKRAFFAGCLVMLIAMERMGEPDISEDDGIRFITGRRLEADAFFRDLILDAGGRN